MRLASSSIRAIASEFESDTQEQTVTEVHMILGLAIVVSFLLLTILNYLRMSRGRSFPWARGLAFAAAGLLLIQYVVGFALLGDGRRISALHYILALAVLIPVGAEHMTASSERSEADRNRIAFFASFAALILVAIVYSIGDSNS
jgi:heme A synthase